jgi:hypothetical protein
MEDRKGRFCSNQTGLYKLFQRTKGNWKLGEPSLRIDTEMFAKFRSRRCMALSNKPEDVRIIEKTTHTLWQLSCVAPLIEL